MIRKLLQYFFTIRYLEPIQVVYRLYYIIKRRRYERNGEAVYARYLQQHQQAAPVTISPDPAFLASDRTYYVGNMGALLQNELTFLNHTISFGDRIDWHRDELNQGTRLWKLNLNYHEFLIDVAAAYHQYGDGRYLDYLVRTIEEWDRQNPIGTQDYGKDNWNSYAISLRVVSWIKIFTLLQHDLPTPFKDRFLQLLWIQCRFLKDNLEFDILGNHLIKNWKALHFGARFFAEPDLQRKADRLYRRFVAPQFTAAGMHEELSPMYAGIVLEDLLEVYALTREEALAGLIHRQYDCLQQLIFGDEYLFFNDSVNANGVSPLQVQALYQQLFPEKPVSPASFKVEVDGYLGFRNEESMIVFDAAPVVAGNQPGHVHCDGLSFEFYHKGRKLFTNSGTYEYNAGERRTYSRATQSHNTLSYGIREQSAVWGSFRVAQRAKVSYTVSEHTDASLTAEAELVGFDFRRPVWHQRRLRALPNRLEIMDLVENKVTQHVPSRIYFHLAPPFTFVIQEDEVIINDQENKVGNLKVEGPVTLKIETTPYFPEFGKETTKSTLILEGLMPRQVVRTIVTLAKPERPNKRSNPQKQKNAEGLLNF